MKHFHSNYLTETKSFKMLKLSIVTYAKKAEGKSFGARK